MFSDQERAYLSEFRLARLATVDEQGHPHVVPTGFSFNSADGTIAVGGRDMEGTRKFRNARANPHVAIVIDDLASTDPWRPRAVEIRGTAEAIPADGQGSGAWLRITPTHVHSWGVSIRNDDTPVTRTMGASRDMIVDRPPLRERNAPS